MNKFRELSTRIPRVRILRNHMSVSTLTRHSDTPCPPEERNPEVHDHKHWDKKIAALMRNAREIGGQAEPGEVFTYTIPAWQISRKFPAAYALCVLEAGYEFGLVPLECSIRIENNTRSGYVTFKKVPAQA